SHPHPRPPGQRTSTASGAIYTPTSTTPKTPHQTHPSPTTTHPVTRQPRNQPLVRAAQKVETQLSGTSRSPYKSRSRTPVLARVAPFRSYTSNYHLVSASKHRVCNFVNSRRLRFWVRGRARPLR